MFLECVNCSNPKVENQETGLCGTCGALQRKMERQARQPKISTQVKKVSQKQAARNIEYLKVRKEYLEVYPCCEVPECNLKATDIHHQKGRDGDYLLDVNYFMAVCRKHHTEIENNPNWSKDNGYSFKRLSEI